LKTLIATLESVQKNFPAIHAASGEMLYKLTGTGVKKDIILTAELCGLMLLRNSDAKIPNDMSGSVLLGAIQDEAISTIHGFVVMYAKISGKAITPPDMSTMTDADKAYLPELTKFERPLYDVCGKHALGREFFPFVPATTSVKLILAGEKLKQLDPKLGLPLVMFHIISGCKTIPFPAS
jgi:hypothetical protein